MRMGHRVLWVAMAATALSAQPASASEKSFWSRAWEKIACHDKSGGRGYTLKKFETDACSSWLKGGGKKGKAKDHYFAHCCIVHDIAYWTGGSDDDRREADGNLWQCIARDTSEAYAELMLAGVRLGGIQCTGARWRWGYGWVVVGPDGRESTSDRVAKELSGNEWEQRKKLLDIAKGEASKMNPIYFDEWCAKVRSSGNNCDDPRVKKYSQDRLTEMLNEITH